MKPAIETKNKLYYRVRAINKSQRGQLLYLTLICIIAINSVIVFSAPDLRTLMVDFTAILTSAAALFVSGMATLWRYLRRSDEGFLWSSIGLMFWFIAEVIWVYNRQLLGLDVPYPSVADGIWFIGYGFLAIYIYGIMGNVGKTTPIERNMVLLVSVAVSLSLAYTLNLTYGVADLLSASEDILTPIVSLTYPILDGLLLVPSIVILWSLRAGDPSSTHWLMMSLSFIVLAMGDIVFGYSFALAPAVAGEFEWISALFYNTGYICIGASVLWYYITISKSKAIRDTEDGIIA